MGRPSIWKTVQRIDGGPGGDPPRSTALVLDVLDVVHTLDAPDVLDVPDAIDGAGRLEVSYDPWASIYDRHWDHQLFDVAFRRLVLHDVPPPARLLDLGCGAGHQAKRLAEAGYEVSGIDVSARLLDHARERAPDCDFVLADLRDFDLGTAARFDVVYSFYDTLNHILDPTDLLSVFRCVRHTLRPGGTLIFDLNTEEAFRGRWQETVTIVEEDLVLVGEGDYDPETRLGDYRITALEREGAPDLGAGVEESWVRREAHVRERCHRTDEVSAALGGAGFTDVFQTSAEDAGMQRSLHRVLFVAR